MKGGTFIDNSQAATIGGRLLYLLGSASYGNYPDIQALWGQYQKEVAPKARKDLVGRIQKLIHERTTFIPVAMVPVGLPQKALRPPKRKPLEEISEER